MSEGLEETLGSGYQQIIIGFVVFIIGAIWGGIQADGNIEAIYKTAYGNYSSGINFVTCTDNSGAAMGDDSVFFQFLQDTPGDVNSKLGLAFKTKKQGCCL